MSMAYEVWQVPVWMMPRGWAYLDDRTIHILWTESLDLWARA